MHRCQTCTMTAKWDILKAGAGKAVTEGNNAEIHTKKNLENVENMCFSNHL